MDLADVGGNVTHGAHIASIGGTWMAVVYRVAGMRDVGGVIRFHPQLPEGLTRIQFALTIRGQELEVDLTADTALYRLRAGESLTIFHDDHELRLSLNLPVSMTCDDVVAGASTTAVESDARHKARTTGLS